MAKNHQFVTESLISRSDALGLNRGKVDPSKQKAKTGEKLYQEIVNNAEQSMGRNASSGGMFQNQ